MQIFEHRRNEFLAAAERIEIFVPQDERSAFGARTRLRNPERACMAEMEKPRGRRRQSSAVCPQRFLSAHLRKTLGELFLARDRKARATSNHALLPRATPAKREVELNSLWRETHRRDFTPSLSSRRCGERRIARS
jgi:hypothetical protein